MRLKILEDWRQFCYKSCNSLNNPIYLETMKANIKITVILKFRLELQKQNPNFDSNQQTTMPRENL